MIFAPLSSSKNAQVTVFILLGLVLLATVVIGIYISSSSETAPVEVATTTSSRGLDGVESFVKNCYQGIFEDGLMTAFRQGGRVYSDQGGTTLRSKVLTYTGSDSISRDVSYGVQKLSGDREPVFSTIPSFPWDEFPEVPSTVTPSSTIIGTFTLGDLLTALSGLGFPPSIPTQADLDKHFPYSLMTLPTSDEVRLDVESFVKSSNSDRCRNFGIFDSQGITVTASASEVKVLFNEDDTVLEVKIPVTASKGSEVRTFENVRVSLPVKASKLVNASRLVATADAELITYSPHGQIISDGSDSFTVSVDRDPVDSAKGDDIIIVTDSSSVPSVLRGEPAEFRFARENRPPALKRVDLSYFDGKTFCYNQDQTKVLVDFSAAPNTLKLEGKNVGTAGARVDNSFVSPVPQLLAFDLDEDEVSYYIVPGVSGDETPEPSQSAVPISYNFLSFSIVAFDGLLQDYQSKTLEHTAVEECLP